MSAFAAAIGYIVLGAGGLALVGLIVAMAMDYLWAVMKSASSFDEMLNVMRKHYMRAAREPLQALTAEQAAKIIYEQAMSFEQPKWVPWVEGGNSDAQEHARRVARAILATASTTTGVAT